MFSQNNQATIQTMADSLKIAPPWIDKRVLPAASTSWLRWVAVSILLTASGIVIAPRNLIAKSTLERARDTEIDADDKPVPSDKKSHRFAIINANLHPMNGPVISSGRVIIQEDKIELIGNETLPIPEGLETIDAAGLEITPGWIDLNSLLWMGDISSDTGASDGSLWAIDSLDPFAEDWQDVIAEGVTTVYVQPSSQGAMGGIGVAIGVAPGASGVLDVRNPSAGLQMSLGTFSSNRDRAARFDSLKKTLQSVADYKRKWDEFEKAAKEATTKKEPSEKPSAENAPPVPESRTPSSEGGFNRQRRGPGFGERRGSSSEPTKEALPASGDPAIAKENENKTDGDKAKEAVRKPVKPERDIVKDRLVSVIDGKTPVRLEVHNANDLRYALELQKTFPSVRWILEGVDQLGIANADLQSSRLPLVLGPWLSLDKQDKIFDTRLESWKRLASSYEGVIGVQSRTRTRNGSRLLREHVAQASSLGIPSDKLLRAVTSDAAKLIGCESTLGVLAPGFNADLVGFSGDPLDTRSVVRLVVSNGKIYKRQDTSIQGSPTPATSSKIATGPHGAVLFNSPSAPWPEKFVLKSSRFLFPEGMRAGSITIEKGKISGPFRPVDDGSITATQPNQPELVMIDLGNAVVAPGLFSAYATLGLDNQTRGTESDSSHLSSASIVAFAPSEVEALEKTGIHRVALSTSSANTLAGQMALTSISNKRANHHTGLASKVVLSEESRSNERFPSSLAGQIRFVRDFLDGRLATSRLFIPNDTLQQIKMQREQVMKQILERKQLVLFQVSEDAETESALRLVREYKLRAAFYGSKNLARYGEELSSLGVSVIVAPVKELDYPTYAKDMVACHQKGVPLFFAGENGIQLRTTASLLVREGMSVDEARNALIYGSKRLFVDQGPLFGFVDGANAQFLVWSDDPLSLSSRLWFHFDQGNVVKNMENP